MQQDPGTATPFRLNREPKPAGSRFTFVVGLALVLLLASIAVASATPQSQDTPTAPPQPLAGQDNYAQNCAPCHGATGLGDGPSAAGLGVPPTALGRYEAIAGKTWQELFNITKNGNMQRMMPPWKNQLSDQQIWDTVAYAWSLHTSSAEIEQGRALYEANCAACHGPDGKGAVAGAPNLADFAATSGVSEATWAASVANGKGAMPSFTGKLSDAEQRASLAYIRSLSLGGPLFRGPLAAGAGVISGTVTNGTTGQPMPGLAVELGIFDASALLEQRTATTDAAGVYRFTDLSTDAGLAFAVRVQYPAGVPYSTDFASFADDQTAVDLPVTVYESTSDASDVRIERVHFIVEFSAGQALVAELLVFSLDGDLAYAGDGNAVLRFTLPAGATDLAISEEELGGRFQATADGFVDLLALPPGQNVRQVLYRYALPYGGGKLELARTLAYPAANINALISDVGQKVTGQGLTDQGLRQTQGGNYFNFLAQDVPAGQAVTLRMTNLPVAADAAPPATSRILIGVLVAAVVGAAAFLITLPILRRGRAVQGAAAVPTDRESLIDALAELDLAHEAGELTDAAYRDQRLRLKAQLRDLLSKEGQG